MAKVEHISRGFERQAGATRREAERREARGRERHEQEEEDRRDS
jgi:hypothetical protein